MSTDLRAISTIANETGGILVSMTRESIGPITIGDDRQARTAGGRLLSRSFFQGDSRSMFHEAPRARTRERAGHVQARLTSRGR